jgi:hypothetical protein
MKKRFGDADTMGLFPRLAERRPHDEFARRHFDELHAEFVRHHPLLGHLGIFFSGSLDHKNSDRDTEKQSHHTSQHVTTRQGSCRDKVR